MFLEYHGIVVVKITVYSFWQLNSWSVLQLDFMGKKELHMLSCLLKLIKTPYERDIGMFYCVTIYKFSAGCTSLLHLFGFCSVLYRFSW
jgi:hypothetical protein